MSDSIKVAIKVRPLIKREKDENLPIQWIVQGNSIVSTDTEMKKRGDGGFCFDHIFDMNTSNADVFDVIVKPIVDAAVNGFNGTVFAYGQTSSGKTYTMMGTSEEPGIVPLAIDHMFDAIANTVGREFLLRISYLEIYKEKVNDLLNKDGIDLKLKEDASGQVILKCKEEITNCPENMLSIMKKGDKHRRTGVTNMNERSSRSHTIFRITIESREAGGDSDGAIQVSQLNLVDLAGSERARQTGATGERFKEGLHINLSLSTLGLVIMQLSESQDGQKYVNFRDSKLTRLLQNSLGGNAMTAIICAVTPAALDETHCSLSFASRAKSVKNKPQVNEVMSDAALLKRYAKQLSKLQAELEKIKIENRAAEVQEMESKLQEKERINQLLEERIELLKTRIVPGDTTSQESFKGNSKRRQTWGGPGMFNQRLSAFQPIGGLPTIKEVSLEKSHRKSIIQSVDLMNQTFQTAFADFELELYETERERVNDDNDSDSEEEPFITKRKHRVTFKDEVCTIKSKNNVILEEINTPQKCNIATQTSSHHASPSTPKHVLRRCIMDLTKQFVELRQFTTLEKQLICQDIHAHEEEGITELQETEQGKLAFESHTVEYTPEVKERLQNLNLAEEKNMQRIISELCVKLIEIEKQSDLEKDANRKTMKQFSELEKQMQNIISEKNEFEYMSCELRADLKKKTAELELKNISVESVKEEEMKKILELERQLKSITSEKEEVQRINTELRTESTKKIIELQNHIENITSERNEFEHMRNELRKELNNKMVELETLKNDPETASTEMISNIRDLEKEIEKMTSEKVKLEQTTVDLRAELSQMSSDMESKIISEQTAKQDAFIKISELKQQIDNTTMEKNEFERITVDLRTQLDQKTTDLESKIVVEQIASQEALKKSSEFEEQLKDIIIEKQELENTNVDLKTQLDKKITDLESKLVAEQIANEQAQKKNCEFEEQLKNIIIEKQELEHTNVDLKTQLDQKITDLESKIKDKLKNEIQLAETESLRAMEKMSELTKQIKDITIQKDEFECINTELRTELNQKISELDVRVALEQTEGHDAVKKLFEFEKHIANITSVKIELEEKLKLRETEHQKTVEKISELEKQIENITTEKNEILRVNNELCAELSQKSSEVEASATSEKNEIEQMVKKIDELEKQIVTATAEKSELERINIDLRTKLNQTTESTATVTTEQTEDQNQKATEKISELEKQIESIISERTEMEHINSELRIELSRRSSELEIKTLEQMEALKAKEKISELENQIESIKSEKDILQRINTEISQKVSEFESKTETEQASSQNAIQKISELEQQIKVFMSEKEESKCISDRLQMELNEKTYEMELKHTSEQVVLKETMEKISELEKQMENIILEKQEVERVNSELREILDKNIAEVDLRNEGNCINEDDNLRNYTTNLQNTVTNIQIVDQNLQDQLEDQSFMSYSRFNESTADTSTLMLNMEAEKSQMEETLYLKSLELDEIKSDVHSLRQDIESLQKTIYLLTTENTEMATKLTTEQENAKQAELNLQNTIDELYARISQVTNEKINLESDLAALNDQLESMRSRTPETYNDEELLASYQKKIDKLTTENIELSSSIAEKNKELESIKESKSLLYDHECMYKEKVAVLTKTNECLQSENDELSTDLIDKIEENDLLKEQCDILKKKIEQSLAMNENPSEHDMEHLRSENNVLKTEIVELKTKVTILSEENTKFSNNLLETMNDLDSSRNEKSYHDTSYSSAVFSENAENAQEIVLENDTKVLECKVKMLQQKVNHLIRLNTKLSDLKLTSCSRCAHLKNMNESRRALKLEAKALNHKLEDLQRKFDRKCEDTEILRNKMNQDLNLSGHDASANVSFVDEMNVSFVEERIQNLNDELQTLKADHDKLTVLYEDKCNELEQLQNDMIVDAIGVNSTPKKSSNKKGFRLEQMQNHIDRLKEDIDEMKKNSTSFTATLNQFRTEKANLLDEINTLKASNDELRQIMSGNENSAAEKVQVLETELTNMSREIEQLSIREKEFESRRLILEVELEDLKIDRENKNALINQLNERISSLKNDLDLVTSQNNELIMSKATNNKYREELELLKRQCEEELQNEKVRSKELEQHAVRKIKELEAHIENLQANIMQQECLYKELQGKGLYVENLLRQSEEEKRVLLEKLQTTEAELLDFKSNVETRYRTELHSVSTQYEHRIKESEGNLEKLNDTLNKFIDENLNLKQELTRLRNIEEKINQVTNESERVFEKEKVLTSDIEKLNEELSDIRICITKELRSLKCDVNSADLSNKSVNEIFMILLQTLVTKEQEMIKTIRETFEKDKKILVDKMQQSADTEKRTITWAKELEAEIEKLQTELAEREHVHKEYQNKISQLDHLLRESTHENEILNENMKALETDFHNLQTEFDKQCKVDSRQEEAIFVVQKREKEAQEVFKSKELELQSKLKFEKEMYEKKIIDLVYTVESYKTKNLELNSTVEGLEAHEKQLKNIIEANSTEIKKNNQKIEELTAELEQLTEAYNAVKQQMELKTSHVEEITAILKNKCDMVSEYKTKLETITPEYETLKEHIKDKKEVIERYRQEIETLKREREEQLEIIKDKLKSEEIKNAGLIKQLNELNNKNVAWIEELNALKEKYEDLQQANAKLESKVRNSTSKIRAEAEMEELKEVNRRLQSTFEGASNRVTELQEVKNQTLRELIDTKAMYDLLLQENTVMKKTLSAYESKYTSLNSTMGESQLDALLLEKNTIALELEYKKLMLNQKEKEIADYNIQVQQLQEKNKELDDELEEYAAVIQERNIEVSELEGKLNSRLTENIRINELEEKLQNVSEENEKLRSQIDGLKMRLQMDTEQTEDIKSRQNENVIRILQKENLDLFMKLKDYKKQLDTKLNSSDANGLKDTTMDQSRTPSKKVQNNFESAWTRITDLQGEKYEIMKELADSRRQCDILSKENIEVKKTLQLYKSKLNAPNLTKEGEIFSDVQQEENKITWKLETQTLLLSQKEKELKECVNKIRDLATKNKDLDVELGKYAATIHERDVEISKLKGNLNLLKDENNKLRSEIGELYVRLRGNMHNESVKRQLHSSVSEKHVSEYEDKCQQLKKKMHDLELQLVSKNGKIATLELQIQSENFPHQRKCKELEERLLVCRSKNTELMSELRKLQKTTNDINAWECDICRRWRINRKDQGCQTIPNNTVRFCSINSGVVDEHIRIQKLEKEKTLMKELCRSRSRRIKELEDRLKGLEDAITENQNQ
ncbi:PREDICTED: centromere-associated protein E-like [Dufourea novaeangliae]|uniref:centromere-associated protein E-like n=1 Tax=Dufourea novaeangliae TaxID=178035 RepID=UPI000767672D|nr:PREDICTED: centromere-associated protein E-like [Dufourea novaeangliae]